MSEKIYAISCNQDLLSLGMDRMRTAVEGMEEKSLSLNWTKAQIIPIVANEKVPFNEDETKLVPIKAIEIPANYMIFQSFYGVNGMGHLSCIGSKNLKRPDEDRTADVSLFRSRIKASVLKGDLLGQVLMVPGKMLD